MFSLIYLLTAQCSESEMLGLHQSSSLESLVSSTQILHETYYSQVDVS